MLKITYYDFDNEQAREIVEQTLAPFVQFIPSYLVRLSIVSSPPNNGATLSVIPSPDYRQARIQVHPAFFQAAPEEQQDAVLHEIVLLHLGEMTHWVYPRLIAPLKDEHERLHDVLDEEYTDRMERAVVEFTHVILEVLNGQARTQG